ncbi:MAG: hypothetical protein ACQEQ8_01915 [Pseudomonadota bacterium]
MDLNEYPYNALSVTFNVTECMHRLKQVINARTIKEVVQWLGVSYCHYKNWKHRKIIPFNLIVPKLLLAGYSIDWLFAPGVKLFYPKPLLTDPKQPAQVLELQQQYRFYMKAMQKIDPLLKSNNLKNIDHNRKELVSAYFHANEGWMSLDSSLSYIARATAITPIADTPRLTG